MVDFNDFEKAQLRNWVIEHRADWQRVQLYIDNLIDGVSKDAIEYIESIDNIELAKLKGKLEAYKELKDMDKALTSSD